MIDFAILLHSRANVKQNSIKFASRVLAKLRVQKTRLSCNFILHFLVFILNKKEKTDIIVTRIFFHKSEPLKTSGFRGCFENAMFFVALL